MLLLSMLLLLLWLDEGAVVMVAGVAGVDVDVAVGSGVMDFC